jgi:hypothetical protein
MYYSILCLYYTTVKQDLQLGKAVTIIEYSREILPEK